MYTIFICQDIFLGFQNQLETKTFLSIIKVAGWTVIYPATRKAVLSIQFLKASILLMISNPRLRPPETIRQTLKPSVLRQQRKRGKIFLYLILFIHLVFESLQFCVLNFRQSSWQTVFRRNSASPAARTGVWKGAKATWTHTHTQRKLNENVKYWMAMKSEHSVAWA